MAFATAMRTRCAASVGLAVLAASMLAGCSAPAPDADPTPSATAESTYDTSTPESPEQDVDDSRPLSFPGVCPPSDVVGNGYVLDQNADSPGDAIVHVGESDICYYDPASTLGGHLALATGFYPATIDEVPPTGAFDIALDLTGASSARGGCAGSPVGCGIDALAGGLGIGIQGPPDLEMTADIAERVIAWLRTMN